MNEACGRANSVAFTMHKFCPGFPNFLATSTMPDSTSGGTSTRMAAYRANSVSATSAGTQTTRKGRCSIQSTRFHLGRRIRHQPETFHGRRPIRQISRRLDQLVSGATRRQTMYRTLTKDVCDPVSRCRLLPQSSEKANHSQRSFRASLGGVHSGPSGIAADQGAKLRSRYKLGARNSTLLRRTAVLVESSRCRWRYLRHGF